MYSFFVYAILIVKVKNKANQTEQIERVMIMLTTFRDQISVVTDKHTQEAY